MNKVWHSLKKEDILSVLEVDQNLGIKSEEIEKRLTLYGKNSLTTKKGMSSLKLFLIQFNQPLIYILLVASIVTALLGEKTDSFVIFCVL